MLFALAAVALVTPPAGPVLSRIETYSPPALTTYFKDGYDHRDPWDHRLDHKPPAPVPPTKVDALVCDVSILLSDLTKEEGPEPVEWTAADVSRVLTLYEKEDYRESPSLGYRPWAHWNFVHGLSPDDRKTLADEIVEYAHKNGARFASDEVPKKPRLLGAWKGDYDDEVTSVALSLDGKRAFGSCVSGGWTYEWETASGKRLASWGRGEAVRMLAVSRDGALAVVGDAAGTIAIHDARTGDAVTTWEGRECEASALAFSADASKLFMACSDGGVLVGDLARRRKLPASTALDVILETTLVESRKQGENSGAVAAFSPDRRRVAIAINGGDRVVMLWDIAARKETESWTAFDEGEKVESLTFSPDGKSLLGGSDKGSLTLWDLGSEEGFSWDIDEENSASEDGVSALAFSPDGSRILAGAENGIVRLFDLEGEKQLAWRAHPAAISSLAFSRDGKRVLSGGAGTADKEEFKVRYWDFSPWMVK